MAGKTWPMISRMDWEFDCAPDGNIALIGEIDLRQAREFVLALAFGDSLNQALVTASQSLGTPFERSPRTFPRTVAACRCAHAAGEGEGRPGTTAASIISATA